MVYGLYGLEEETPSRSLRLGPDGAAMCARGQPVRQFVAGVVTGEWTQWCGLLWTCTAWCHSPERRAVLFWRCVQCTGYSSLLQFWCLTTRGINDSLVLNGDPSTRHNHLRQENERNIVFYMYGLITDVMNINILRFVAHIILNMYSITDYTFEYYQNISPLNDWTVDWIPSLSWIFIFVVWIFPPVQHML